LTVAAQVSNSGAPCSTVTTCLVDCLAGTSFTICSRSSRFASDLTSLRGKPYVNDCSLELLERRWSPFLKSENLPISTGLSGDPDDLDAHYRRYGLSIRRYILRRFGAGPPDPDDAVQAAFERFARLEDKAAIADPGAFLRRSAHNFVLDHHRAEKVRAQHANLEVRLETNTDDLDPERVLSGRERFAIIEEAIRIMDEKRRDVLIMSRIHGLSSAEIARQLHCSPTLVKMRLAEAVTLCQRALRAAEGDR